MLTMTKAPRENLRGETLKCKNLSQEPFNLMGQVRELARHG